MTILRAMVISTAVSLTGCLYNSTAADAQC